MFWSIIFMSKNTFFFLCAAFLFKKNRLCDGKNKHASSPLISCISWSRINSAPILSHKQVTLFWHCFKSVIYVVVHVGVFVVYVCQCACVCVCKRAHERMCEWCWCVGDSYVFWLITWLLMAWVVMTIFSRTSPWWPWLDTHTHTSANTNTILIQSSGIFPK